MSCILAIHTIYEHLYSPKQAARQTEDRLYTHGKEVHITIKYIPHPKKTVQKLLLPSTKDKFM